MYEYDVDLPQGKKISKRRGTSTCQRHDLSLKFATIGVGIQCKLKHGLIPELSGVRNWRQVVCWKYKCDIMGPGGFAYRSIFDAMRAEKMKFMVDQLDIHTFLEFLRKSHASKNPKDVVTVSDDNFLSQNNLTLNHAVWEIVRRKVLYGYIRQRLRRDPTYAHVANVLFQRGITPILFYPHATEETYYYGKLSRNGNDTTYQKTTLRKNEEVDVNRIREEVTAAENVNLVTGKNVYGILLMQAIKDHNLHKCGHQLNLRASRKLNSREQHVVVPMYNMETIQEAVEPPSPPLDQELEELIDDLLEAERHNVRVSCRRPPRQPETDSDYEREEREVPRGDESEEETWGRRTPIF